MLKRSRDTGLQGSASAGGNEQQWKEAGEELAASLQRHHFIWPQLGVLEYAAENRSWLKTADTVNEWRRPVAMARGMVSRCGWGFLSRETASSQTTGTAPPRQPSAGQADCFTDVADEESESSGDAGAGA